MKRTIDLLEEVMELGFDKEEALTGIDASLDGENPDRPEAGVALEDELIEDEMYDAILNGFKEQAEYK